MSTSFDKRAIALIADMNGDAQRGHIDAAIAMRITYALVRKDSDMLAGLAKELTEAGWHSVIGGFDHRPYVSAYSYICEASKIVQA